MIPIRDLKQTLNYVLNWKKVHGIIKFNQKAWIEPYKKMQKNDFENDFFKLISNTALSSL